MAISDYSQDSCTKNEMQYFYGIKYSNVFMCIENAIQKTL
jgi:hypothetical protein